MSNSAHSIIGESKIILDLLDYTRELAQINKPVLIIGERGTGKELISARLHYLSQRWQNPFITLNCATLTDSLLESELFGHERGSFTGANQKHVGKFEQAHLGSFFLDEIANTTTRLQQKILRAIEYGEIERVGGHQTVKINTRIIAATNVDLRQKAEQGLFQWDLLDRLSFEVITIPPLRERGQDIIILAEHFAVKMIQELNNEYFLGFTDHAKQQLLEYPWPGNVRELKNVVERSVFHACIQQKPVDSVKFDPFISPFSLGTSSSFRTPNFVATPDSFNPLISDKTTHEPKHVPAEKYDLFLNINRGFIEQVFQYERHLIDESLKQCIYNQKKAAEFLKITYHQLRGLLKKHGIKS